MNLSAFKTKYAVDLQAQENGVWITMFPAEGDMPAGEVRIRRSTSRAAQLARVQAEKKHRSALRSAIDRGTVVHPDIRKEIDDNHTAFGIIADWRNIPVPTGEGDELAYAPYTPENALKVFAVFPDFREDVLTVAVSQAAYAKSGLEDDVKNSGAASSSTSDGAATTTTAS